MADVGSNSTLIYPDSYYCGVGRIGHTPQIIMTVGEMRSSSRTGYPIPKMAWVASLFFAEYFEGPQMRRASWGKDSTRIRNWAALWTRNCLQALGQCKNAHIYNWHRKQLPRTIDGITPLLGWLGVERSFALFEDDRDQTTGGLIWWRSGHRSWGESWGLVSFV